MSSLGFINAESSSDTLTEDMTLTEAASHTGFDSNATRNQTPSYFEVEEPNHDYGTMNGETAE